MAGRDNAFDMQIKLLMIGDSGVVTTISSICTVVLQ
jgi:hypothetical protein